MALSSGVLSSGRRQPLHGGPGDSRLIGTVFSCPLLGLSSTPSQWTRGLTSDWHCLLMSSPRVIIHHFKWHCLLVSSPRVVIHPFRMALSFRVLSSGRRPPLHSGLASEWHRLLMSSPQVVVHPFTVDQGLALNGSLLVLPCCWPLDVRQYVVPQVAFSHDIARCQLRLWLKYCFQNTSHTSQPVVKAMGPFFLNGAVLVLIEEIRNNETFL